MQATPSVYLGRTHFINGRIANITVRWAVQELESSLVSARVCLTGAPESGGDAAGQVCVDVIEAPAAIAEATVTLDATAIGLELIDASTAWAWIQVLLGLHTGPGVSLHPTRISVAYMMSMLRRLQPVVPNSGYVPDLP